MTAAKNAPSVFHLTSSANRDNKRLSGTANFMKTSGPRHDEIRMRGFRVRRDLAELLGVIDVRIQPVGTEMAATVHAAGRRLAAAIASPINVPGFDRAAMDGFAVRANEVFGASAYNELSFEVVGRALPGSGFAGIVGSGEAVEIMTGSPMPAGADAVVPAECARSEGQRVYFAEAVAPTKNVSRVGEDIRAGSTILTPPRTLRPQDVAVCIAAGIDQVPVFTQPRIAILVTGNELLPAGGKPAGHQIVDSNSIMLAELAAREGGVAANRLADGTFAVLRDDRHTIQHALTWALADADCVLLCGGSSVGVEDHASSIVAELGELTIHGLALRPASPAGLGFVRGKPVFLVPGNPVSCLCAFDLFIGRAIRLLGGRDAECSMQMRQAPLASNLSSAVGRVDYVRVRFAADGRVEPLAIGGAGNLSSTVRADGYVVVPKELEGYPANTTVEVVLYDAVR